MSRQYLVPQYIEMADKIVGPLSLIQFLYLLAGGVLVYFFWSFFDRILAIPLSIIVGSFFLAMAFLKINDQSFPKMLIAAISYFFTPKERVWTKIETSPGIKIESQPVKSAEKTSQKPSKVEVKSQLAQLATMVDSGNWSKTDAFAERVKSQQETKNKDDEVKGII